MSQQDPYAPPAAQVLDPAGSAAPIRKWRILAWGALLFVVPAIVYVTSGIFDSKATIQGMEVDDLVVAISSFVLYLVFMNSLPNRHFRQLLAVFCTALLLDILFSAAFFLFLMIRVKEPGGEIISSPNLLRSLLTCLLAYGTWYLTSRRREEWL